MDLFEVDDPGGVPVGAARGCHPAPARLAVGQLMARVVNVPRAKVALSTASCYPETCTTAFEMASDLGFDGVEVMVWTDPVSQDPEALRALSDQFGIPILAIHAPCLLLTQRVWTTDPWTKLERARDAAEARRRRHRRRTPAVSLATGVRARVRGRSGAHAARRPPWCSPSRTCSRGRPATARSLLTCRTGTCSSSTSPATTLDLSHTAVSGSDALVTLEALGDRLAHVHLADGLGTNKDEHLVPGRGGQPCGELLERLARRGYSGSVVLEINTRRAINRDEREADLAEGLAFARFNLASASPL